MSSQLLDRTHPVSEFAGRLCARLTELAGTPTWSMSPEEQRTTLVDLARAQGQVEALRLRVLAEAERAGAGNITAAASVADWAAAETRQTRISARSDLKVATGVGVAPGPGRRRSGPVR